MKTYLVGGALRDELLGLPVNDRDYVVVGATVEHMLERGFKPVGKDFPVFLHPKTHEEYALARTERKVAAGYQGFHFYTDPSVTIEEDLQRRDLTINAIARCGDGGDGVDGVVVDPYGGQVDLKNRVFRHVSDAFAEDPVRILRIARFSARFAQAPIDFSIAPETMNLMRKMVDEGEVDALVPERVWQEIATGLMENTPSRMFEVLRECGALQRLMPELNALWGVPQPPLHHPEIDTGVHIMLVVDYAAAQKQSLAIRFAALMHDLGKGVTPKEMWPRHHGHEERGIALVEKLCARLKVPSECRDLAIMTAREHGKVGRAFEMRAATLVELFEKNDAIRRPERFHDMLQAAKADCFGRSGLPNIEFPQVEFLTECLAAARAVNAGEIAQGFLGEPKKINEAVRAARVKAVAQHPLVQSKLQN